AKHELPIYAECGGMMYLSRRIAWGERSAEMVGVLPCEIEMTNKPQGHGYVVAQVDKENPFFPKGRTLRGHEFHNSRMVMSEALSTAYHLSRGNGLGDGRDGIVVHNVLASYTHLHVGGAADWARNLVQRAQAYRQTCKVVGNKL
ncbi:MAG: cobyrinic acid a,c-diamide synthase, partial [Chloroflexi bacterium]